MADFRLKMGETLDINTSIGANSPDVGVTYSVGSAFASVVSVGAGGVVTPIAPGMAIVEARNADGVLLRSVSVEVVSVAQATLEGQISSGVTTIQNRAAKTGTPVDLGPVKKGFNIKNTTTNTVTSAGPLSPITDGGSGQTSGDQAAGGGSSSGGGATLGDGTSGGSGQTSGNEANTGSGSSSDGGATLGGGTSDGSGQTSGDQANTGGGSSSSSLPAVTDLSGTGTFAGGGTIAWAWTAVAGATEYEYVAGASSLAEPVAGTPPTPAVTSNTMVYSSGGMNSGETVKFWIRAKNATSTGPWVSATQVRP